MDATRRGIRGRAMRASPLHLGTVFSRWSWIARGKTCDCDEAMTRNPITGPARRTMRLRGYDYTGAGAYFVTICTFGKACILGHIRDDQMVPSEYGSIVLAAWDDIPNHVAHVDLDAFALMPNHLHAITVIADSPSIAASPRSAGTSTTPRGAASGSLGAIVGSFKAATTRRINALRGSPGATIWQRDFYDHIVRDERSLDRIRHYIGANPSRWAQDDENPANRPRR
jgi:putative transposase